MGLKQTIETEVQAENNFSVSLKKDGDKITISTIFNGDWKERRSEHPATLALRQLKQVQAAINEFVEAVSK